MPSVLQIPSSAPSCGAAGLHMSTLCSMLKLESSTIVMIEGADMSMLYPAEIRHKPQGCKALPTGSGAAMYNNTSVQQLQRRR